MAHVVGISSATLIAFLNLQDYYDTCYSDNFTSWPELLASVEGKDEHAAEMRAWHRERAMELWPLQRLHFEERCRTLLSRTSKRCRALVRRRSSFVVRHRSRQVRLYV